MKQIANLSIGIKTTLSIEEFLRLFSNIEWIEEYGKGGYHMKNNYAYFSVHERLDDKEFNTSFCVHGYINTDDLPLLLTDLNNTKTGYWVDLTNDEGDLIETKSGGLLYDDD